MAARQPVRCRTTGLWLARYRGLDGKVRQAGRFAGKKEAQEAILAAMGEDPRMRSGLTLSEFFARWPRRFPRHPRTERTNLERISRYVLPHLPRKGDFPIVELRRAMLRDVQDALLRQGLSKTTIDGAFSSLSAMLSDAVDDELLDANPARGFRVRPSDPRLSPSRRPRPRRAVPSAEIHSFAACIDPGRPRGAKRGEREQRRRRYVALLWTPALSGARPGETFALRREDVDRKRSMVFLHQTVDKHGGLQPGLKTTHHVEGREARGRWTLCPPSLIALFDELPPTLSGWLFHSPRGKLWNQDNFQTRILAPAKKRSELDLTLYDLRHTFSSRLLAGGIPLVEVAAWMGHSLRAGGEQVNTTSRTYAHPTGEWREPALELLEAFYADGLREAKRRRSA